VTADVFLFWFLAVVTIASALSVVLFKNPIFSALSLAMTMVSVGAVFVTLSAYFIAGVQLIVYAGAVMVLFVMVVMLFDLKQEVQAFTRGKLTGAIKLGSVGMLAGLVAGAIYMSSQSLTGATEAELLTVAGDQTRSLGQLLFTKYIFGFEVLGILLLVVAVGTVALSRSKGGTHAKH
jgi:NADH-quinone oxidoreductase subunit J